MAKNKQAKRAVAMAMAATLSMGMAFTAFAETETVTSTTEVETKAGITEEVEVTIEIEKTETDEGLNIKENTSAEEFVTDKNMTVDYEGSSDMTTGEDGYTTGSAESSYTSENIDGSYVAKGGSELTVEEKAPEVTVEIPVTSEDDPETKEDETTNTVSGGEEGSSTVEGNDKSGKYDGTYDYTTTTVVKEGSVTVTTESITVVENVEQNGKDMEHISSEVTPDADNDMHRQGSDGLSKDTVNVTPKDGYEYVHLGTGNSSQFWAAYLYTTPADENEKPVYVDENGQAYYNHYTKNAGKYYVEGLFLNGEQVVEERNEDGSENKFLTNRGGTFQFVMYDPATGEKHTTYCADLMTGALDGWSYNIENLEEADYYTEEEAEMIRTVAKNGYWSTKDDASTEEAEFGSLEAVKEMMRNAYEKDEEGNVVVDADGNPVRKFSDTEVDKLTDGMALTATQYAIWTFSNKMDNIEFVNTQYCYKDDNNKLIMNSGKGFWADVPEEERENDSVDLIFKLYEHLINLEPTKTPEKTTANTIINAENFVDNMNITVVEKAEDHENNEDDDDTNDAYVTDLSFALVVEPSTENGDDLVVKVVGTDGNIIAEGRVAGENKEGENYETITPDENGNYKFTDITLTEGDLNFKITLEGIQNLEQGVYLYTSEVRGKNTSQTMVGVAEGEREVDVEMNISFEFSVEDEIVAKERVWRKEWDDDDDDIIVPPTTPEEVPPVTPPTTHPTEIIEEDVPLADIPEEDIPLVDMDSTEVPLVDIVLDEVPLTSAPAAPFMGLSLLSALGLFFTGRRRKED